MKPRIFINIHYLEIGGAETSLIGLLQTLDPSRVDVDLFINDHRGEMMRYIPGWVNILPECKAYTMIERPIKEVVKAGYIHIAIARLWAKNMFRRYVRRKRPVDGSAIFAYVGKYVTPLLPSLKYLGNYDLAISYVTPHNIVLGKVQARKKICWIHSDYTRIDVDTVLEYPVWNGYDRIVSISEDVTRTFCQAFPALRGKIIEIENVLSSELIRHRAESGPEASDMPRNENGYTLLTIGRFSYPKRLEAIPLICRLLTEKGLSVKWYIIGYGSSDDYIRKAIIDERMENNVVLLGKRDNPYPYIKACDWYIQPSRYEGKSVVVREAQILGKPVIITDYPTSASQVQNGVDGIIIPMDVDKGAEAMTVALSNEKQKKEIVDYLAASNHCHEEEVGKIYSLIN